MFRNAKLNARNAIHYNGGLKLGGKLVHPRTISAFQCRNRERDFQIVVKGENTDAILLEIGLTTVEIEKLNNKKIIK